MSKQIEALKMVSILLCVMLTGCSDYYASKCVDGKFYDKWCEQCQFIRNQSVECLDEN